MELVRENDVRLRRICGVYTRDSEAAKDLYQEILMQLWRALPSFDGNAKPGTWVYRVALNTALTRKRADTARRAERHDSLDDTLDESQSLWPNESLTPDERLDAQQQLERLYVAIDRLDDLDKALVTLFLNDASYREMSHVLGISENHVAVKLHRIKKELAARLAEDVP